MTQLFGLVVCGGKSSRMGEDKSLLIYHSLPQRYYLYEMMQPLCEKVFLSCNRGQADAIHEKYNVIADAAKYENTGPMAALLSAFELYHDASFLTIGCDYPFIKKEDLIKLIGGRNENALAISYYNKKTSVEEPLLAIYENGSYPLMKNNFENKKYSLRYFLQEINAAKIVPDTEEISESVNTREQFRLVLKKIHHS